MFKIFLLFTLVSHAQALVPCGKGALEFKHPSLNWKNALNVRVNTNFMNTNGLLCIGLGKNNLEEIQIVYRDENNNSTQGKFTDFILGKVIVTPAQLPPLARAILKNTDYVSVKFTDFNTKNHEHEFVTQIIFHRNLAKNSQRDVRVLKLNTFFNMRSQITRIDFLGTEISEMEFELSLMDFIFYKIELFNNGNFIKLVETDGLDKY